MTSLRNVSHAIAASALFAFGFAATAAAQAVVPNPQLVLGGNLWSVTAFDDSSPAHTQLATQGICFEFIGVVGTHLRYRWRSTTFPDWNGMATQEGDQIFMHGDYAQNVGHDGMKWEIVTQRNGAGHWFEWRENGAFGQTIGFANTQWQRTGTCPVAGVIPVVPPPYLPDGTLLENPVGRPPKQP